MHTRRHGQTALNEALDLGINAVRPQTSVSQQEGNYNPLGQGGQIGVFSAFLLILTPQKSDFLCGKYAVLRKGKRDLAAVELA